MNFFLFQVAVAVDDGMVGGDESYVVGADDGPHD